MKANEAHIASVATAVPYPISTEQFLEKDAEMRRYLKQPESLIKRMKSFVEGTGIHTRHFSHPHWFPNTENDLILKEKKDVLIEEDYFTPNDFTPPFWQRMKFFEKTAIQLSIQAAQKALDKWGGDPQKISHIVTTCTSGWSEPGIAVSVTKALGLSHNTQKAELNFNGCFCGATCLRLARDIIRAGDATGVLVVATEVASNHYDVNSTDLSSLVAHSLFADGSAAVILTPDEGKWKYTDTGMSLIPDSDKLLRLNPPFKSEHNGYQMYLDRSVGRQLGKYFREGYGSEILKNITNSSNKLPALGIHPGGPNILDNVKVVFDELGWNENAMDVSYDSLQSVGNLGAAAMLFVLERSLESIEEDDLVTMAFGPGVTVEWARLEKVK